MNESNGILVSVPSRGLSYLNNFSNLIEKIGGLCFRPLTGTLLSKYILDVRKILILIVSVPSRGLSYLNQEKIY